jgi:hypothetical protein
MKSIEWFVENFVPWKTVVHELAVYYPSVRVCNCQKVYNQ